MPVDNQTQSLQPQSPQQQLRPVKLSLRTGELTHKIYHYVLYSIVRSKFIKGMPHSGVTWGIDYLIYPGYYLMWYVDGYKDNRGLEFGIRKIHVTSDYQYEVVEDVVRVHTTLDELRSMASDPNCPESLRLFIASLPQGYHSIGTVPNLDRVFDQGEVERVRAYLDAWVKSHAEY